MERSGVLLGLISCQNLEKRTEKNGMFLLKNGKERNVPNGKERGAQPCLLSWLVCIRPCSTFKYYEPNLTVW